MTTMQATWEMRPTDLARVFADHFGWTVRGNWIRANDRPVACGWEHLAHRLATRGLIVEGQGVNWRKAGERPTLPPVTRDARGHWDA